MSIPLNLMASFSNSTGTGHPGDITGGALYLFFLGDYLQGLALLLPLLFNFVLSRVSSGYHSLTSISSRSLFSGSTSALLSHAVANSLSLGNSKSLTLLFSAFKSDTVKSLYHSSISTFDVITTVDAFQFVEPPLIGTTIGYLSSSLFKKLWFIIPGPHSSSKTFASP